MSDMPIEVTCRVCLARVKIQVDCDGYNKWREGSALIQNCLPKSSLVDRELLISSTCGPCFEKMFPPEEEGQ